MTQITRRTMLATALAGSFALAGCSNGVGNTGADQIDARVDSALNFLYANYPGTADLRDKSTGMLVMPLITEAGFGLGGAYGRGALRVARRHPAV